jgi:hypothetical protein
MTTFKGFASFVLAASVTTTLSAKTHCPWNVESVPLHFVNGYQMVVAVSINHSGPFDFLLDTGTQFTIVDPSLASELRLNAAQGSVPIDGMGFNTTASSARLDQLAIGSHTVAHLEALVYDLQNLKSFRLHLRGVLGEDFLQHFDMLIDNAHKMLCLDESSAMRSGIKGPHITLVTPMDGDDVPANSLIISVRLSGAARPLRLKLDSGANAPFLYGASQSTSTAKLHNASLHGTGTDGTQRAFVALPPQDMKIGSLEFSRVPFFTLASGDRNSSNSGFDGLLTMGLFRCVFICHSDHFAILDPR